MRRLSAAAFAEDPGGHAAIVLDDGGFEWVDLDGIQFFGEAEEHWLVDQIPLGAVGDEEDVAAEELEVHADARAETTEQHAAGFENTPEFGKHGAEVMVVAGEVEYGVAEDDVGCGVRERHVLDLTDLEVFRGQAGL